jgi:hypothetical protein
MLSPFRFLARWAALLVGVYLVAACAVARWTILPEHRAMLGAVAGLLLAGFILSERKS